jgi:RNA 2',3'-cyclic 3'-phosphodiesterase
MRLFIAIDLAPDIRGRLDELIGQLRPLARITWSPTANLHITTKFIGQWPEERLPELREALAGFPGRKPIPIRVHGLGFFPNPKSPRVFWAGVDAPPELTALAAETDSAVAKLGVEPESRAYSPHLTLARIRTPTQLAPIHKEVARLGDTDFGAFVADRFFLYLSKPGPSGSVYTKLSEFPISTK